MTAELPFDNIFKLFKKLIVFHAAGCWGRPGQDGHHITRVGRPHR